MKTFEEEHKRKDAIEILKLAGVLDNVDDDVAELCIQLVPKGKDRLISLGDLMTGVQKIKDDYKQKVRDAIIDVKNKLIVRYDEDSYFEIYMKELLKELGI